MNRYTGKATTKFERWWDKEDMDSVPDADFTFGEEIWKTARRELLREQRRQRARKGPKTSE